MNNWKTTTLGILTILGGLTNAGVVYLQGNHVDLPTLFAAITAGWGLIHASDSKATSNTEPAKEKQP
jgi:hypothetical protein